MSTDYHCASKKFKINRRMKDATMVFQININLFHLEYTRNLNPSPILIYFSQ
uniref:Uncharacterized protein n=1 Tax=Arundo donax TaxID=35708 RepID=A0A0A9BU61_ARUDO